MTNEERDIFVEGTDSIFYLEDSKLFYHTSNKEIKNLSILVDFNEDKDINPILLKVGEYDDLLKIQEVYSLSSNGFIEPTIIEVPNELYKWVDVIMNHSASNWINHLVDKIERDYSESNLNIDL